VVANTQSPSMARLTRLASISATLVRGGAPAEAAGLDPCPLRRASRGLNVVEAWWALVLTISVVTSSPLVDEGEDLRVPGLGCKSWDFGRQGIGVTI
jgi:hypothetical protein